MMLTIPKLPSNFVRDPTCNPKRCQRLQPPPEGTAHRRSAYRTQSGEGDTGVGFAVVVHRKFFGTIDSSQHWSILADNHQLWVNCDGASERTGIDY